MTNFNWFNWLIRKEETESRNAGFFKRLCIAVVIGILFCLAILLFFLCIAMIVYFSMQAPSPYLSTFIILIFALIIGCTIGYLSDPKAGD